MKVFEAHFEKNQTLQRQIFEHMQTLLASGKLAAGSRLPSTHALAETWQTTPRTVHLALTALVKQGALTRVHGRGTFVRRREKRLTCMGIYDVTAVSGSLYGLALHAALKGELTQAGIEPDVWLDPRSDKQGANSWTPFVKAAMSREFQAMIALSVGAPRLPWLTKMPVPCAFQGLLPNIPSCAGYDMAQFAELSLRALAKQGCRSVGLIVPLATKPMPPGGLHDLHGGFFDRFTEVSRDLGLTVRNPWMRLPSQPETCCGQSQDEFGYRQFLDLWRLKEKPDGLIVYPDTTARGVILAAREQQVRVPADLKLVLHKNEAVVLLCPMPATFAVSSERAMARALIAQAQTLFRGGECRPIQLPFALLKKEVAR